MNGKTTNVLLGSLKKKHFDELSPHGPETPPPTNVDYVFFAVPIIPYTMKEGKKHEWWT